LCDHLVHKALAYGSIFLVRREWDADAIELQRGQLEGYEIDANISSLQRHTQKRHIQDAINHTSNVSNANPFACFFHLSTIKATRVELPHRTLAHRKFEAKSISVLMTKCSDAVDQQAAFVAGIFRKGLQRSTTEMWK
jgi:hypothetical protein